MRLDFIDVWEYNYHTTTYKQFVEEYKLQDIFYTLVKRKTETLSKKEFTRENMYELFDEELEIAKTQYNQPDGSYYILENLARMYITINDLFDQVFFIETIKNNEWFFFEINFYNIVPNDQADLKRYIEKHLDAYKNGFGEVVEDVIERRSRNTPK